MGQRHIYLLLGILLFFHCQTVIDAAIAGSWSRISARVGSPPLEVNIPSCTLVGQKFYVHGGRQGLYALSNSMHYFDLEESTWVKPGVEIVGDKKKTSPSLYGHSMSVVKNKFYMFGGRTGLTTYTGDMYEYNTETDTLRLVSLNQDAERPSPRQGHSAIVINQKDIFILGGRDGSVINNELWTFDTEKEQWRKLETKGVTLPPLEGHAAVLKQNKMYVFGGNTGHELSGAIYVLDLATNEWQKLSTQGRPRAYHTATLIGNYIYVIAGSISNEEVGDVHVFDTTTERWVNFSQPSGAFHKRQGHCAVGYKTGVYVFGGSTGWKTRFNDVTLLDTDPETTRKRQAHEQQMKPKKDLSVDIEETIVSINLLADMTEKNTTDSAIEMEIAELISKDSDADEFVDLPRKIAIWKQIGDLYHQLLELKKGVSSTKISRQVESVTRVREDYKHLKRALIKDAAKIKTQLNNLKEREELASSTARKVAEITISAEGTTNTTRRLGTETNTLQNDLVEQNKKIASIKADIVMNEKRLSVIQRELEDDGTADRAQEKNILDQLEVLNAKSTAAQSEFNEASSKIHSLSISISNAERELSRLDDLKREIEELKSKFEKTMETQQIYASSRDSLIKRLKQSEITSTLPTQSNKDLCQNTDDKWLEQLLSDNQADYEKQLKQKKEQLTNLESTRDAKRKEVQEFRHEIDSIKKELERVQARLRNQETLHKEYESETSTLSQRIVEQRKRLDEEELSLSSMNSRLVKVKEEYAAAQLAQDEINASLKKAKEEEAASQRVLTTFKSELQGEFATLSQALSQCKQQGDSLEVLRNEIVSARNEYVGQREGLERARESIASKILETAE